MNSGFALDTSGLVQGVNVHFAGIVKEFMGHPWLSVGAFTWHRSTQGSRDKIQAHASPDCISESENPNVVLSAGNRGHTAEHLKKPDRSCKAPAGVF